MIKVIFENGHFNVKGTFFIGIAGVFENKNFGDENIEIRDTLEDILAGLNDENSYLYKPLLAEKSFLMISWVKQEKLWNTDWMGKNPLLS